MRKISFAVLLLLMASASAWAAPRTADEWYEEGANQYTLGNFEKAIDAFKAGFSLSWVCCRTQVSASAMKSSTALRVLAGSGLAASLALSARNRL